MCRVISHGLLSAEFFGRVDQLDRQRKKLALGVDIAACCDLSDDRCRRLKACHERSATAIDLAKARPPSSLMPSIQTPHSPRLESVRRVLGFLFGDASKKSEQDDRLGGYALTIATALAISL